MNHRILSNYLFEKAAIKPISKTGKTDLERAYEACLALPLSRPELIDPSKGLFRFRLR